MNDAGTGSNLSIKEIDEKLGPANGDPYGSPPDVASYLTYIIDDAPLSVFLKEASVDKLKDVHILVTAKVMDGTLHLKDNAEGALLVASFARLIAERLCEMGVECRPFEIPKEQREKTSHEMYQKHYLRPYKKATSLPVDASLAEVIKALVNIGQPNEATELLFGGERNNVCKDNMGFLLFMGFWAGETPELLKEVAENHFWSKSIPDKGFAIRVYPDEYLVIKEPTATKVLRTLRP
jgi:hypothetical protein